ncbi:hypothetical protein LJY25_15105 [Hymenobacter sp. BT175]|uniref:hypothetical protein n=1 Tax=Hymenobacter translucens TaxID=2886507 RepID=UPI001D0DEDE1|nr:hypothetical protein [Hymenobacter translucens]MCC2547779.1 hypothetical protein [Hymenobacter translucens]
MENSSASSTRFIDLSYRPDLKILVIRWLSVATDEEIRQVYRSVEEAAQDQCRFWLVDARRRPSFSPVITQWLFEEFSPRVAQRFGGPLFFSYLVAPVHLADAQEFLRTQVLPAGPSLPYRLHYASEEGEATDWLLQSRQSEAGRAVPTTK